MNRYIPRDPAVIGWVALILAATLGAGLFVNRLPASWCARVFAWLLTITGTAVVERLCRHEPAGVRMLAIIGTLLYGMKSVVTIEARHRGKQAHSLQKSLFAKRPSSNPGKRRVMNARPLFGLRLATVSLLATFLVAIASKNANAQFGVSSASLSMGRAGMAPHPEAILWDHELHKNYTIVLLAQSIKEMACSYQEKNFGAAKQILDKALCDARRPFPHCEDIDIRRVVKIAENYSKRLVEATTTVSQK